MSIFSERFHPMLPTETNESNSQQTKKHIWDRANETSLDRASETIFDGANAACHVWLKRNYITCI
jgi:hypothetical protein